MSIDPQIDHFRYPQSRSFGMSSKRYEWWHLAILLSSLLSLSIAGLDSANARFAFVLRDRVRADYPTGTDGILDHTFEKLQTKILTGSLITAIPTAGWFFIGILVSANSKWLQNDDNGVVIMYSTFQTILVIVLTSVGGYLADGVHGYQATFKKFSDGDNIPYYSIIYYGNIAKAAYGPFLLLVLVIVLLIRRAIGRISTR